MRSVISACAGVVLLAGAGAANATTYDLAGQFGAANASSPWSYGYFPANSSTAVYFPQYSAPNPVEAWSDPSLTQTGVYGTPNDAHNTATAESGCCSSVVWLPGQATFHPGQNGERAFYEFTAPWSGLYSLAATFSGRDYAGPTDTQIQVLLNGVTALFTGTVDGYAGDSTRSASGASPSINFDQDVTLSAGDSLYFTVGFDPSGGRPSGPFYYDTTGIAATIDVPEPASLALLGFGLAGLGAIRRRG